MGPPGLTALARCVGDPDEFLAERFTRSPHTWSSGSFDDLLSLADVDAQLTGSGLRRPSVRVVRDGQPLDPSTWTRPARTGGARVDDLVHPGRVLRLFDEGATIVLQSLQRWWEPLTRFCGDLESALGHTVQANAYLTPGGAAGLTPHHDTHDVFVLQVHGTKHWTVREPLVVDPLVRHRSDHERAAEQPVLFRAVLQPGDCLYLPRGYIHSATTQEGASLHLTIGVLVATVHDVLRRLMDRAADEPAFRRTLPPRRSSDTADRELLKGIVAELGDWLDRTVDTADDQRIRHLVGGPRRRPPLLRGQLLDLVSLDELHDGTRVLARAPVERSVEPGTGVVRLDVGDRSVELPARLLPALELLLDGAEHELGQLGRLMDRGSRLVLVGRLIREGVLTVSRSCDDP